MNLTTHNTNYSLLKPHLEVTMYAGAPNFSWKPENNLALKILVDRGDGFKLLAVETHCDYLDRFPPPASGQTAIWKYKAIYFLNDLEVGQWSDEVEVKVVGVGRAGGN